MFDEIFVQPASGDNGTAIGACYLAYKKYNKNLKSEKNHNFYLGSSYTNKEILSSICEANLSYSKSNNIFKDTAKHISNKKSNDKNLQLSDVPFMN